MKVSFEGVGIFLTMFLVVVLPGWRVARARSSFAVMDDKQLLEQSSTFWAAPSHWVPLVLIFGGGFSFVVRSSTESTAEYVFKWVFIFVVGGAFLAYVCTYFFIRLTYRDGVFRMSHMGDHREFNGGAIESVDVNPWEIEVKLQNEGQIVKIPTYLRQLNIIVGLLKHFERREGTK